MVGPVRGLGQDLRVVAEAPVLGCEGPTVAVVAVAVAAAGTVGGGRSAQVGDPRTTDLAVVLHCCGAEVAGAGIRDLAGPSEAAMDLYVEGTLLVAVRHCAEGRLAVVVRACLVAAWLAVAIPVAESGHAA